MWWAYPLPPGIGGIIIVLMILAIPQVPMGLILGALFIGVSSLVTSSGEYELFAICSVYLPSIIGALLYVWNWEKNKKLTTDGWRRLHRRLEWNGVFSLFFCPAGIFFYSLCSPEGHIAQFKSVAIYHFAVESYARGNDLIFPWVILFIWGSFILSGLTYRVSRHLTSRRSS